MNTKKSLFFILFVAIGTWALNIKLNNVIGSKATFTLFDSLAPIAGQFLGTIGGVASVLLMQIINLATHGFDIDLGHILRLFPTIFAVLYFSRKSKWNTFIPMLAMFLFMIHPTGNQVWYYSLFWLIPIAGNAFYDNLFVKSLGATFTAHAVGGVLWLYAFNLPAEVWVSLIPVVIVERLLFASGIAINYVQIKKLVDAYYERTANEVIQS